MEESFSINEIGKVSGRLYTGTFTVKTLLTRRDQFEADRKRREILGPQPQDALDALKFEAFMLGQLSVRVMKGPNIWEDTNGFVDCEDINIIQTVFDKCTDLEKDRQEKVQKEAEAALKKLASKDKEARE